MARGELQAVLLVVDRLLKAGFERAGVWPGNTDSRIRSQRCWYGGASAAVKAARWRVPVVLRGTAFSATVLAIVAFGGTTQKFIHFDF